MTVIVDPIDPPHASHDARILLAMADELSDAGVAALIRALAGSLSAGAVLAGGDELISPAEAGRILGVSRQYVDKLIASGRLPATTKPGSSHRLIPVVDLIALERQRRTRNAEAAGIVDDLIDAGVDY